MPAKKAAKKVSKTVPAKKAAAKEATTTKKAAPKKVAAKKAVVKKVAKKAPAKKALKPTSLEEIRYAAYLNSCARIAAGHAPDEIGDWLAAERALGA